MYRCRELVWRPGRLVDLPGTLGVFRRGTGDPTVQVDPSGAWWLTGRWPTGAATLRLRLDDDGEVVATSWGEAAEAAVAGVPDLLGAGDRVHDFAPEHPVLREVWRRRPGVRVPRSGRVVDALVPAVLEQKVTGLEAHRAWRLLVRRFGAAAPGPAPQGMRVPPSAEQWRRVPSWEWHRAGVDAARSRTVVRACRVAGRLEEALLMPPEHALARLRAVPGIGPWTAAEVAQRALGDADAVSVGDYHLPSVVGFALAGTPTDDDGMLALLAAYRPHRHRVVRLVELSGLRPARRGPRMAPRAHLAF